jgi:hypothetical protein
MTSALVSSSSRASTTAVCSRRPFHRKSSGIKTTKRYAQKILSRFAIFSFSFSSRFPANRRTDGANFLSLFYSLISIHRRISITPRAENEGDSASTTTPAASAAPKLVPSNAASIKVHERIRLEKFCFFCFSRSKSFFFFLPLSLGGDRVSLSFLLSQYSTVGREKSDERRDFLCRQHKRFFVRMLLCFSAKREGKYYSEKLLLTVSLAALIKKI